MFPDITVEHSLRHGSGRDEFLQWDHAEHGAAEERGIRLAHLDHLQLRIVSQEHEHRRDGVRTAGSHLSDQRR